MLMKPDQENQKKELDQLCINTIRTLSMDAVQAANSGHPGTPMALAPVAYCLWQRFLRFDDLDRFHLVGDVIDRVPKLGSLAAYAKQSVRHKLIEHKEYVSKHGDDMPEVRDWHWPY